MAAINITIDRKRLEAKLTKLEKRVLPAARLRAINNVAFEARGTVQKFMGLAFDRPTPFTVRSPRYTKGTQERPAAEVYISQDAGKGTAPSKYLQPQARGGVRRQKRSERVLERAGIIGRNEGWVPAKSLRLNRYGNITGPKMVQILSQVKAFSEVGFQANVTRRSKARNPKRAQYFIPNPASRNRLARGVYARYGSGGRKIRPILLFVKLPRYQKRFDLEQVVRQDVNRRIDREFHRALAYELRRAGIRR